MSWWNKDQDEADDDEENDESEYKSPEDRILFLIDARKPMMEKNILGEVHLVNCLKVLVEVMKSKIIASDKSSVGVVFFGVRFKDAEGASDRVHTLFPPDLPSASRIRKIQSLVDDINLFHTEIGSQEPDLDYCPLREALWVCSQAFHVKSNTRKVNDLRRIWIFTNDDKPNAFNPSEQDKAVKVARDCSETGIEISLWHMNRVARHMFDPQAFYVKILTVEEDDDSEPMMLGAGDQGFDLLIQRVRQKQHKKRRLGSLMWSLGEAMGQPIAVHIYKMFQIAKKPNHTWLYSKTNEPLQVRSKYIDGVTGESLDDTQIETYLEIGGCRIPCTADEMKAIKLGRSSVTPGGVGVGGPSIEAVKVEGAGGGGEVKEEADPQDDAKADPRLKLLFFAPKSRLSPTLNLEAPYFIFPDDATVANSSSIFSALLMILHERDLVAFVSFAKTKSSIPRLAALIPQMEVTDELGQVVPPGFNVVTLPFLEEVRGGVAPTPDEVVQSVSEEMQAAADGLVQALACDAAFDHTRCVNAPAMQRFYSVLQAVALAQDAPEWTPDMDNMVPDRAMLEDHASEIFIFKEITGLADEPEDLDEGKSKKRGGGGGEGGGSRGAAAKRAKANVDPADVALWKDLAAANQLLKQPAAGLKEICASLGVAVSGTKAVLVERITGALATL